MENADEKAVDSNIATLAFSEVSLGRVLGKGGFSVVHAVREVVLQEVFDTSENEARQRGALVKTCYNEKTNMSNLALKTLRDDLPEDDHTKGILDLAVEAQILKTLSHPHIIAMRAVANSDPLESRFFVVLDRLVLTLEHKMSFWRKEVGMAHGAWLGPCGYCCSKKHILHKLWVERIMVIRDIATAIRYLHHQNTIYRDLKPDNIGFNQEGELKIFDLGLAKPLNWKDKNSAGLYMMTGNTGSLRYMAPEVAMSQPYDLRADSYSFGILFWQICALSTPYAGYSCKMHSDQVVGKGYRPKPNSSWPISWSDLMRLCWSSDIFDRPDFDGIVNTLEDELEILFDNDTGEESMKIKSKKTIKETKDVVHRLDIDTRQSHRFCERQDSTMRRHNVDIV